MPGKRNRQTVDALPDRLKQCPVCLIYFAPLRRTAVYCSSTCRTLAYQRRKETS